MKLINLKFGNVVKLRNGNLYLIHPLYSMKEDGFDISAFPLDEIQLRSIKKGDFDFRLDVCVRYKDYNIMEIYEDYTLKNLLWKREEKTEDLKKLKQQENVGA